MPNQRENNYNTLRAHAGLIGGKTTNKFKCPCHDDGTASGVASLGNDGRVLLKCHGCGASYSDILQAWGFEARDAFPPGQKMKPATKKAQAQFEAEYIYLPNLKKVKVRQSDGGKYCYWQHLEGDRWVNKQGGIEPPLFTNSIESTAVFLVEGEKDVLTLGSLGAAAVTMPDGADSKWKPQYDDYFRGKVVCIIQDNDDPGKAYAQRVAADLQGIASSVQVLDLTKADPDLPYKGDVTDLMQRMGSNEGMKALLRLVADTPEWEPTQAPIVELEVMQSEEWETPIPFDSVNTPDFPTECLPAPLATFVEALAESTQTPTEMSAVLSLGVLATALQSKFDVEITHDWKEPLCLYTVAIAEPGERKSAVISALTKPIYSYEYDRRKAEEVEVRQSQDEKSLLEQRLEAAKKLAAKAKGDNALALKQEVLDLSAELAVFKVKHHFRLLVDDTTVEKLTDIMDGQGGCITVASAEGGLFDSISGRYDRAASFDIYLKGHAGDQITVDRIGRKPNSIENPRLTTMLTIQPEVVTGLMENATFRGRGLCGRFLYAKCKSKVGRRDVDPPPIPSDVRSRYSFFVRDILSKEYSGTIHLSDEAQRLRVQYAETIERRLAGEWDHMRDWGGKALGAMVRIAALIHAAEVQVNPADVNISEKTVAAAIKIMEALCVHAMAVYQDMGSDQSLEDAKYLLRRLESTGQDEISKRDLWHICKGKFRKVEEMEPALQALIDMGHVREIEQQTGGRPTKKLIVNPLTKSTKSTRRVS